MRVRVRELSQDGKPLPLDDASWTTIQLASYLHGRDVTEQELEAVVSLARRQPQTRH